MDIVIVTTILSSLFLVIGVAEPLAAWLRLPYSVILAGVGSMIAAGAAFFLHTELTDALNPVAEAILGLPIRSNVFLYVFLPTLLFQATLGMELRRMLDDWVPILMLGSRRGGRRDAECWVCAVLGKRAATYSLFVDRCHRFYD